MLVELLVVVLLPLSSEWSPRVCQVLTAAPQDVWFTWDAYATPQELPTDPGQSVTWYRTGFTVRVTDPDGTTLDIIDWSNWSEGHYSYLRVNRIGEWCVSVRADGVYEGTLASTPPGAPTRVVVIK